MAQINLRVTDEQKQRWKDVAAEDERYQNLTHLIELAMQHELDGDWVQLSRINAMADNVDIDMSGFEHRLDDIHDDVVETKEEMERLRAFGEVLERETLREIAMDAYDFLPRVSNPDELDNTRHRGEPIEEAARRTGNPTDIRRAVESHKDTSISNADIRLALDFLTEHYATVEVTNQEGFRLYYEIDVE